MKIFLSKINRNMLNDTITFDYIFRHDVLIAIPQAGEISFFVPIQIIPEELTPS
jgi:hypothetical protein